MTRIFISFATEDFVTLKHHDAVMRLCKILTARGICGSFHLTGDYARALRAQGRDDVIAALRNHEIGYHSNTHGAYPFIGSVCEDNNWDQAVGTLMLEERRGIRDIEEVMGSFPKYYVTEFTKAPQLIDAMVGLGIDLLGFSDLPGSNHTPFVYYGGALCYTGIIQGLESQAATPGRREMMLREFDRNMAEAKRSTQCIKLFNHPYKFIYDNTKCSWVSKNRLYREYRLDKSWDAPEESCYPAEVVNRLFDDFEAVLDYALSHREVTFVSTSELAADYRLSAGGFLDWSDFIDILPRPHEAILPRMAGGRFFSPAEIFGMMVFAITWHNQNGVFPKRLPIRNLLGPTGQSGQLVGMEPASKLVWMSEFINRFHCLPDDCGCYYHGLGESIRTGDIAHVPESASCRMPVIAEQGSFTAETWTKASYPDGFTGQNICRVSRTQTWSYKPAVLQEARKA